MYRQLRDLTGVGPAMLKDFELPGVRSVEELARRGGREQYGRLSALAGRRQDACAAEVFQCAVAEALNPRLPRERRRWWYGSRRRKARRS
jgi:hypothetical protein